MCCLHANTVDMSFSHVCTDEWHLTASTLCPLSLPHKKVQAVSPSYAQSEAQMNHPQRILGLFVAILNATHITFGARLVEERRIRRRWWTILTFDRFRFATLNSHYSLFMLSMPGSQNRKYYIIGTHIYYIIGTHVYYILMVYHVNAISTLNSHVIFHNYLAVISFAFLLPIVDPLLAFYTVTYSAADIFHSCTTMPRKKHVRSDEKKRSFFDVYNYTSSSRAKSRKLPLVEVQQENSRSCKFCKAYCR